MNNKAFFEYISDFYEKCSDFFTMTDNKITNLYNLISDINRNSSSPDLKKAIYNEDNEQLLNDLKQLLTNCTYQLLCILCNLEIKEDKHHYFKNNDVALKVLCDNNISLINYAEELIRSIDTIIEEMNNYNDNKRNI